jgi:hypothetical protein
MKHCLSISPIFRGSTYTLYEIFYDEDTKDMIVKGLQKSYTSLELRDFTERLPTGDRMTMSELLSYLKLSWSDIVAEEEPEMLQDQVVRTFSEKSIWLK